MRTFAKGDRIPLRVQQVWTILTAHAMLKPDGQNEAGAGWSGWGPGIVTYGDLAKQMGYDPKAAVVLAKHLGVIGYYCQENDLPPLNSIAVNSETGVPGYGVVETEGFERDQKSVHKTDWFAIKTPSVKSFRDVYERHIAVSRR
jgi:hypothetical protein